MTETKVALKVTFVGLGDISAEIDIALNPRTARAVLSALPVEASANRWGDEIYFEIPVHSVRESSQTVVKVGDVAYWPPGRALCIFFGPTPVSRAAEPRAYSPVNVIGRITQGLELLKKVSSGTKVRVSIA